MSFRSTWLAEFILILSVILFPLILLPEGKMGCGRKPEANLPFRMPHVRELCDPVRIPMQGFPYCRI
jgi:hypothetical protein